MAKAYKVKVGDIIRVGMDDTSGRYPEFLAVVTERRKTGEHPAPIFAFLPAAPWQTSGHDYFEECRDSNYRVLCQAPYLVRWVYGAP